ncbi:HD domain-containing protein [Roseococcus suduntuyensis]|uniref:Putative hydrolase of HD superfamily n=1 Tax=Roseococcus suduntuyensis TaxID=455361 RepID=A0A840AA54_9PROT|nr:HD domain-containing protein [Roseococcus suduntuyensis]MBB3897386.1 putative hydrolase of HD superfamily [Roseococcus suduntuyensis]
MPPDRLAAIQGFLNLCDRLKHVHRAARTQGRLENSAEHAWHVAMIAVLLAEEVDPRPDLARVLSMIAVHDVIEIEAGDTFAFDEAGLLTQQAREQAAAARIFGTLPPDLAARLSTLWAEFEAQDTPDARFAMGCDRLQGFAQQVDCGAPAWKEVGLTRARSLKRMQPALDLGPPFAPMIEALYTRAMAEGLLRE